MSLRYEIEADWLADRGEWVATSPQFPSLRWLSEKKDEAVGNLGLLIAGALKGDYSGGVSSDAEDPGTLPVRAQVLREAERLVCGDREGDYGDPTVNLHRIAQYWTDYLYDKQGDILTAEDVAMMMILMKVARQAAGYKRDSVVDIAGYAAIAAEAAERKAG
ncbi:DUF6378 domain-containing protein [Nocardia wallacei]|uniref:DUF6378 domain-containing protein n=1 Tax=Nocardia wallacei TaxID=480035 RepID=UPI0024571DBE|nr:DUF6378 domain-containing protein [Nocardia wallacei]